ncbi:hypothetical protein BGZ65_005855, partial [Modicella reniformis]
MADKPSATSITGAAEDPTAAAVLYEQQYAQYAEAQAAYDAYYGPGASAAYAAAVASGTTPTTGDPNAPFGPPSGGTNASAATGYGSGAQRGDYDSKASGGSSSYDHDASRSGYGDH